jgi:hypothetical protein
MRAPAAAVVLRSVFALACAVGVAAQFDVAIVRGDDIGDFFSYFTYEVNLFAAVVFALGALQAAGRYSPGPRFDGVRGASATYLALTGLIFNFLLAPGGTGDLLPWVNLILHQAMPIAAVLEWCIWPPRARLPLWIAPIWLIYPLAYLPYSEIRGALTGFYAYPFFDPAAQHGYGGVAIYCSALIVAFLILGTIIRGLGMVFGRLAGRTSAAGGLRA